MRILDANFDRASEGLRVIEEYARFVQNDSALTEELKQLRHRLAAAFASLPAAELLAARNTPGDVGCEVATATEYERTSLLHVVRANFQRVQQALRSIEEYSKTFDCGIATAAEAIRYATYALESKLLAGPMPGESLRQRLQAAQLYVLVAGGESEEKFRAIIRSLVVAEVDVLQLRDKSLDDRALLGRARLLREATCGSRTLFILNDRPDLACLAQADGVHVGQSELPVSEVRQLVGAEMLIGVSTHNLEQADQAAAAGADYLGCGPTFPSSTKSFREFAGLKFLQEVSQTITIPAFAIGGIDSQNLSQVLATGFSRIAVRAAVTQADPAEAVRELKESLCR